MRFICRSAAAAAMLAGAAWLAGCSSPPPAQPKSAEETWALNPEQVDFADALARYGLGIAFEAQRDFDSALTNYVQAAALDPDNEDLHYQVAMALVQRKRYAEALDLIEKLSVRKPESERALLWIALIYRAMDRADEAMATYKRALEVAPTSEVAYVEMASIYARSGKEDEAIRLLERGVARVSKPEDLLRVLAGIYLRGSKEPGKAPPPERLAKAIELIEEAVANSPDDQSLMYQLGDLYILNHQIEKAIQAFEQIEKQNPDDLSIKQKLGMSFVAVGDKDKAIATLQELSARQPDNSRLLYYLAELYDQSDDQELAMDVYERITRLDPPEPSAYLKLALMQSKVDADKALATLRAGIERMPDDPRLREMLAYVHLSKGDYKDALEPFADATRLMAKSNTKPFVESFNLKYAIAAQLAGRTDDAAERLYDAMGANASYLDAYMQYIFQSQEQTSIVQSVAILNKISERRPDDASVHLYLGLLNSYAKFYPAALAAFEKAEQLAADSPEREDILTPVFYFWFAAACERSGMIDRAEELFNKCIELDAAHAEAYNYLAYMWAEKGVKLDQAMDMIRKALKLDPTSGAFIDTLGWIYFMQGKYDDALKSIGKASEILPDDPTIIEHMGSVHDKLGEPEKALEYWKQSFALDPTNEALATKLKDLGVDLEPLREKAKELEKQREEEEQEEEGVQEGEPAETEPDAETEPAPEPAPKDAAPAASPNE